MSEAFVLDASALLCLLNAEPGAGRVAEALPRASISAVNLSEVVAKLADAGGTGGMIDSALRSLHLRVVPFGGGHATAAGLLRPLTKAQGLSFGDRACLALAAEASATALTADRAWAGLPDGVGVRVEVIR